MNTVSRLIFPSLMLLAACTVGDPSSGRAPFVSAGDFEQDDDGPQSGDDEGTGTTDADTGAGTTGGAMPDEEPGDSDAGETTGGPGETTGEPEEPMDCDAYTFLAPEVTPEIMFVLDRSSSMVHTKHESYAPVGDDEATSTRWEALHALVGELVDDADEQARFGAVLFPSSQGDPDAPGSECFVDDEPAVALGEDAPQSEAILGAIPSANATGFYGATPMRAAVDAAAAHLLTREGDAPRALVLVTDGAASCVDGAGFAEHDDGVPERLEALALEHDISTFVVGVDIALDAYEIPAVNPYAAINKLAVAGGRPMSDDQSYYDEGSQDALAAGLTRMAREVQCAFVPEVDGHDLTTLELTLAGESLARVDSCAGAVESGWRLIEDGDDAALELCGQACEAFAAGEPLAVEAPCGRDAERPPEREYP